MARRSSGNWLWLAIAGGVGYVLWKQHSASPGFVGPAAGNPSIAEGGPCAPGKHYHDIRCDSLTTGCDSWPHNWVCQ